MTRAARQERILERIGLEGGASVSELADQFNVSSITIHRDLELLADQGLVVRVHGGARSLRGRREIHNDFTTRLRESRTLKRAIAARAAAWVDDGATIFVDASTTGLELVRQLELNPPNSLTLVTNSPAIAHELTCSAIHLIVAPGEVDQNLRVISGQWTVEFLRGVNVAVAFISCFGITLERGLTTGQRSIADTLTAVTRTAARTVALVDSTKFGRGGLLTIAAADEVEAVVVDDLLLESERSEYAAAGVNLVVAPVEPGG